MKLLKKELKKVISILITVCLLIGVANIPSYSMPVIRTSSGKTTDAVLGKQYLSVAQAQAKSKVSATVTATANKSNVKTKIESVIEEFKKTIKTGTKNISTAIKEVFEKVKEILNTKTSPSKTTATANTAKTTTKSAITATVSSKVQTAAKAIMTKTNAVNEKGKVEKENSELTKILSNFGKVAAGYTYHSFPKYDAANNAYTLISTGKNNYKLEISVEVGKGENAKEQAKQKAEKIGTALLWGKSAGEIQEVLKNAKVVVKQNDKTVANFNSLNKNANVNSLAIDKTSVKEANFNNIKVNPVLDATTVAKETVKNVLGVSETSNKLKSSIDQTVISKYTEAGYNALKSLANKLGLSLQTVYDKFVQFGVTTDQMKQAVTGVLKVAQKSGDIYWCTTLALSAYLGISMPLAAVQQIAADIARTATYFNNGFRDYSTDGMETILTKNGVPYVSDYCITRQDLLNMAPGTKYILIGVGYNSKGEKTVNHAVTVGREQNGEYGVSDILFNDGDKVIYSRQQFERFLDGETAIGRTAISGITLNRPVYLYNKRYKFDEGFMLVVGDSSKVMGIFTREEYDKDINFINNVLNNKTINQVQRTWFEGAKNLINNVFNSTQSDEYKMNFFRKASNLLYGIEKQNFSMLSITEACFGIHMGTFDIGFSGFSSLKSVLKNDITYKEYEKYGRKGVEVINRAMDFFKLSQEVIYEQFTKNGITKDLMDSVYANNSIPFDHNFWYYEASWSKSEVNIPKTFTVLKQMSFISDKNSTYNKNMNFINNLLQRADMNQTAKIWLEKSKQVINEILNSDENIVRKEGLMNEAYSMLQEIANGEDTMLEITKATLGKYKNKNNYFDGFKPLKSVLKDDVTYKIYMEYNGDMGINVLNKVAEYFNISRESAYEQFIKNAITENEMIFISRKLSNVTFEDPIWYDTKQWLFKENVPNTFIALKKDNNLEEINRQKRDSSYNQCINTIDNLLKRGEKDKTVKTWIEKAKELVKRILNNAEKTDFEKYEWFTKANSMLIEIANSQDIMSAIATATVGTYKGTINYFNGFDPLRPYLSDYFASRIHAEIVEINTDSIGIQTVKKCNACVKIIDLLLWDDTVSKESKKWLNNAKNLMIEVFNSEEKTFEEKKAWFDKIYYVLKDVEKNKASISYINTINLAA